MQEQTLYLKMLEEKWAEKVPKGYTLKFVETKNEAGETILTTQLVKDLSGTTTSNQVGTDTTTESEEA